MNQKKKVLALLVISLGLVAFLSGTCLAQTGLMEITVKGKIAYLDAMGGYYVQGANNNYLIMNQNPGVLAKLAKSGKTVTVTAEVVAGGDSLNITTIKGKPYQGEVGPDFK